MSRLYQGGQYSNGINSTLANEIFGLIRSPQARQIIADAVNRYADIPLSWTRPTGERVDVTLRQILQNPQLRDRLVRTFQEFQGGRLNDYLQRTSDRQQQLAPSLQRGELEALMGAPESRQAIQQSVRQLPYRSGLLGFNDPTGLRREYFLGDVMANPELAGVITRGSQNAYNQGYADGYNRAYNGAR